MLKECDNHPNLNHSSCDLDSHEQAVAVFFESRGLKVERLCTSLPDRMGLSPDFKVWGGRKDLFLCEVKRVLSSTAALPEADWRYDNAEVYRRLTEASQKDGVPLIALPDQIARWKGEIPYPAEGRNTKQREQEYERKLKAALQMFPIAHQPLSVTIDRHDPYIWRNEETEAFVNDLAHKLELIAAGQTPHNWFCDFGVYRGHYRQPRDHGRFVQNSMTVRREGDHLSISCKSYLGINWPKIEKDCHEAQRQIGCRLKQESEPQEIARVAILFLDEDLVFEYIPDFDKLKSDVRRHVQKKSPDLSAVAFCSDLVLSNPANLRFIVFHVAREHTPKLAQSVFDNGVSGQVNL